MCRRLVPARGGRFSRSLAAQKLRGHRDRPRRPGDSGRPPLELRTRPRRLGAGPAERPPPGRRARYPSVRTGSSGAFPEVGAAGGGSAAEPGREEGVVGPDLPALTSRPLRPDSLRPSVLRDSARASGLTGRTAAPAAPSVGSVARTTVTSGGGASPPAGRAAAPCGSRRRRLAQAWSPAPRVLSLPTRVWTGAAAPRSPPPPPKTLCFFVAPGNSHFREPVQFPRPRGPGAWVPDGAAVRRAAAARAGGGAAMVLLHVKRGDESQFLLRAPGSAGLGALTEQAARVYNARLKVQRVCSAAFLDARSWGALGSAGRGVVCLYEEYLPLIRKMSLSQNKLHSASCLQSSRWVEMEELAEHGVFLPPNMQGLTDEQIEELKLRDEWGEKCVPSGGAVFKKDDVGRRNGHAPNEKMKDVLKKTIEEAKAMISKPAGCAARVGGSLWSPWA
ncbi:uncharacterized protein LOC118675186 isoform X5 [Myotis myotis]|uniref:uncharacterized protein LOC118675186 isoform X5 n=1 Tax=Myotis myotis TaxID=51298 RepID=UPI00174D17F0|nr:uncharacterized protein LOC118675186 isoform X5 [Myotis myotis]